MKILTAAVLAAGLATGGAIAQTTSATSKAGSGPNFKSDDERVMYEENADRMGGFFTDETMTEMRPDTEVKEIFAELGKDDQAEIKAACERAMENRGSYGTITVSLCEQVDAM
ncbi:hypothetical protein GN330_01405 [Nitratireductor sp. CAU 1489]|uniref:Uncharacterized protein n=1 Tax=Nitratireductor arenosus TaxID=2682096 RepID=A0A844QD39_9HYPH|nr:hypothetical protein [Nitratireductor arenosus]MVA95911.1 hypothetical protein [Nitratireductor arenosus]